MVNKEGISELKKFQREQIVGSWLGGASMNKMDMLFVVLRDSVFKVTDTYFFTEKTSFDKYQRGCNLKLGDSQKSVAVQCIAAKHKKIPAEYQFSKSC